MIKNSENHFGPIQKSKRIFEEVAARIKESILKGVWKPGDRLPSENDLAGQFDVSRHTIREALRTLELSGFLEIKTGVSGGPIVKDSITTTIGNLYVDALQMESFTAEEFTTARIGIEKAILIEVLEKADEQDIKDMKDCIAKSYSELAQKRIQELDHYSFHSALANASKNKVYMILEKGISTIHRKMRMRVDEGTEADYKNTRMAYKDHEKILDAIIKRDQELALKLLEKHLIDMGKTFSTSK